MAEAIFREDTVIRTLFIYVAHGQMMWFVNKKYSVERKNLDDNSFINDPTDELNALTFPVEILELLPFRGIPRAHERTKFRWSATSRKSGIESFTVLLVLYCTVQYSTV
jgi:hypothetical protein